MHEFNPQSLANTAWAFSVADPPAVGALFGAGSLFVECAELHGASFGVDELCQLHQWQLWCTERGNRWVPLSSAMQHRCRSAFLDARVRGSRFQNDVCKTLRALATRVQTEVLTSEGYRLDMVAEVGGIEFAVEVDGPSHFLANTRQPTGATLLKRRQLKHFGVRLVSVPYWEWDALVSRGRGDGARARQHRQREEYLARHLSNMAGQVGGP